MQAVILAGGLATRLGPLTEAIPKSMVRIGDRPFLEYQIEVLRENGIEDLLLCVGYLGELVQEFFGDGERFGVRISYSFDGEKLLGTGGALKKAESFLQDEFFLMYGDSYLLYDYQAIKRHFDESDKLSLLVVYRNEDRYDRSNVIVGEGRVEMYDKENRKEGMVHIDSGLSALRKKVLELIPDKEFFDLGDLYQELVERKQMLAYEIQKRFYEIGSFSGLKEFEDLIKGGYFESHQILAEDSCKGRQEKSVN